MTLEAISNLGHELDNIVWNAQDEYSLKQEEVDELKISLTTASSNVYTYQEAYNDANEEAEVAEQLAQDNPTDQYIHLS